MFNRIYIGIFLSVVLALASSYVLYSVTYSERKEDYQKQALSGALQLILNSSQNQQPEQRQAYFDIVSRLFGAELTELSEGETSALKIKLQVGVPRPLSSYDSQIRWLLPVNESLVLQFQIPAITEQLFRAHALLFVAELSRNNPKKNIDGLQDYSSFPLELVLIRTVNLDAQQTSRLRRGSVVVSYSPDNHSTFKVYAPMPDDQVLVLGPVAQFDRLPMATALMMVAATILVIVAVSGWLVFRMDRRLQIVNSALHRFGEGETTARVELSGHDHISALGERINDMSMRISKLLESQRYIMQAVSHELRTPLARVRFRLEMLEAELGEGHTAKSKIDGVRKDLNQLEELIGEVLEHHRLTQIPKLDFCLTDVTQLIREARNNLEILFPEKSIELRLCDASSVNIHESSISKLMQNLMSNACKHAQAQVLVITSIVDEGYRIQVEDDGPGIKPEDREKVFEAFYRSECSHNHQIMGYGLGLAIASRVANLHNAEIKLETSKLGGACFQVTLPFTDEQIGDQS